MLYTCNHMKNQLHIIHPVVLQYTYIKIILNFVQFNTTYFSGGNIFRLINKSSLGHPVI
jgi:hypothetical protein